MSRFAKRILSALVSLCLVGAGSWFWFFDPEEKIPLDELSRCFGKDFFTPTEDSLVNIFIQNYKKNNLADDADVIVRNKFAFREIHCKLLQHFLYLQVNDQRDSSDVIKKLAYRIADVYDQKLNDSFLRRETDFCGSLNRSSQSQKLTGDYFYDRGQEIFYTNKQDSLMDLARNYYQKSLRISRHIGDKKREIDNLAKVQYFFYKEGNYKQASKLAHEILSMAQEIGYRYRETWALYSIINVQLNQGEWKPALAKMEAALQIARQLDDQIAIMRILERISVAYRRLGKFSIALKAIQESMRISEKCGTPGDQVRNQINLGLIYENLGDYTKAIYHFEKGYQIAHEVNDLDESTALGNLGETYRMMGDFERASRYDSLQLKLSRELKNFMFIARSQEYLGNVAQDQSKLGEALAWYEDALTTIAKGKKGLDLKSLEAEIRQNIGEIRRNQKSWLLAIDSYQQSLETFKEIEQSEGIANVLNCIGNAYRELKETEKALYCFEKSRQIAERIKHPTLLWNSHYGSGLLEKEKGNFVSAADAFRKAIDIAEKTREKIFLDEDRMNYFATIQDLYDEMILSCFDQAQYDSAFHYSERAHARACYDLFYGKAEIIGKDSLAEGCQTVFDILNPTSQLPPLLAEVQRSLSENIIMIEYKITKQHLVIFVVDKNKIIAVKNNLSKTELQDLVMKYRISIGVEPDEPYKNRIRIDARGVYRQTLELAYKLYEITIQPIQSYLSPGKTIYFIPDDVLNYVPFSALVPTKPDSSTREFFIHKFPVAYAPSAAILKYCLDRKRRNVPLDKFSILAVGNPGGDLPGSQRETQKIAAQFSNAKILLKEAATKDSVLALLRNNYQVLHFAMHVVIDEKNPLYSYLVFKPISNLHQGSRLRQSLSDQLSESDLLMTHEVFLLNLPETQLVTLSACYTGGGRLYRGEGIVGMTRAFMKAGAPSVITSLWKIDDKFTEKMMTFFYEAWTSDHVTKAQALQTAQLKMIDDLTHDRVIKYPHPYLWAPFILTGDQH